MRSRIGRRAVLNGVCNTLALLSFPAVGRAATDAAAAAPFLVAASQNGLYIHPGQVALTTPANRGDIANLTVIVGDDAAAVIDTGGSVEVGAALHDALRRVTDRPLRYVINTHEHPDHTFGNAAFAQPGVTFVGHRNLPRAMADRWGSYQRSFTAQLGAAAMARVRMVPPTLLVADRSVLDLGGRRLVLNAWPPAHTNCDLTVIDEATGTLVAGDLLFSTHIPVVDGSAAGWLALLPRLASLPVRQVIAGHGVAPDGPILPFPSAFDDERRYLTVLLDDARRAVAAGATLEAAVPRIAQSERDRWALFDAYNPRNATEAYSAAEWE